MKNTCSDKGAPESILLLATFPAITFGSVSRMILHKIWRREIWVTPGQSRDKGREETRKKKTEKCRGESGGTHKENNVGRQG